MGFISTDSESQAAMATVLGGGIITAIALRRSLNLEVESGTRGVDLSLQRAWNNTNGETAFHELLRLSNELNTNALHSGETPPPLPNYEEAIRIQPEQAEISGIPDQEKISGEALMTAWLADVEEARERGPSLFLVTSTSLSPYLPHQLAMFS